MIEDESIHANTLARKFIRDDGDVGQLFLVDSFSGRKRVPRLRRALVVAIPDNPIVPRVRHKRFAREYSEAAESTVLRAQMFRWRQQEPAPMKVGDWIWYSGKTVASMKMERDGVTYTLLGIHQFDFVEVTDPTSPLQVADVDYR